MSESFVPITPGSGADVSCDLISSAYYQNIKLDVGSPGVSVPVSGSIFGLPVDIQRSITLNTNATLSGTGNVNITNVVPVSQFGTWNTNATIVGTGAILIANQITLAAGSNVIGGVTQSGIWTVSASQNGAPWSTTISGTGWINIANIPTVNQGTSPWVVSQSGTGNVNITNIVPVSQSGTWSVSSSTAIAGIIPSNAFYVGGLAKTANPAAASDGNLVGATFDKLGKQVTVQSIRALKSMQLTTITSSTTETSITASAISTYFDLYGLLISNTSTTACQCTIKDQVAGTNRFIIEVPALDTRGFMLTESAAHPMSTLGQQWTCTCGTSVASINITTMCVQNI